MKHQAQMHLFRGSPAVRSWSKYQTTVEKWTLCGIDRGNTQRSQERAAQCTEDVSLVTCRFCHQLMRSSDALAAGKASGETA